MGALDNAHSALTKLLEEGQITISAICLKGEFRQIALFVEQHIQRSRVAPRLGDGVRRRRRGKGAGRRGRSRQ